MTPNTSVHKKGIWPPYSSLNNLPALKYLIIIMAHRVLEMNMINDCCATPFSRPNLTHWWLIRSGCGSKLRGTAREFSPGRLFVIGVVHIQCLKLFKGLECIVLSMVLCTMKNHWSHSKSVGHNPGFGFTSVAILPWLCNDVQRYSLTHFGNTSKDMHTDMSLSILMTYSNLQFTFHFISITAHWIRFCKYFY